jgi:hypothetical protein
MPDDKNMTFRNCIGMCVTVVILYGCAYSIASYEISLVTIALGCLTLALVILSLMYLFCTELNQHTIYITWSLRAIISAIILIVLLIISLLTTPSTSLANTSILSPSASLTSSYLKGATELCQEKISSGSWTTGDCNDMISVSSRCVVLKNMWCKK